MKVKIKEWIKYAGIRAIKTICQTAIATIGTTTMFNQVDWKVVGYSSLLAGILSLLTSLAGLPELEENLPEYEDAGVDLDDEED